MRLRKTGPARQRADRPRACARSLGESGIIDPTMISVFVRERGGRTQVVDAVQPEWLAPESAVMVWVDLAAPTPDEGRILSDVFHFHPLSVEDALSALQFPKIEPYPGYLYVVLHGIDVETADRVRDPRRRLLRRCQLPRHRSRRRVAQHREAAQRLQRARRTSCPKARSR